MKILRTYGMLFLIALCYQQAISQTPSIAIKGTVKDSINKETITAVSIIIQGTPGGIFTDDRGVFSFTISQKLPVTLLVTHVNYEAAAIHVTDANQTLTITLKPNFAMGQVTVTAPSRVPQSIIDAMVSVEQTGRQAIRNAATPNYFDIIRNLKGVDVVNSGMFFATPTTRGFSGSGNARLNQIVDGMDNLAPGLNFPVGNSVGLTELDVDNIELLPGASSALYGSGGMNGTLLINSKNPFIFQGFSIQVKQGVNHINDPNHGAAPYYDIAGRYAKVFNNKFAFKITAQYVKAQDWQANDRRNYNRTTRKVDSTNRINNPNYNGVNVYGDENNYTFIPVTGLPAVTVSRTGYNEDQTIDHNTFNLKGNAGLFYKVTPSTEISFQTYLGRATTVYTGSDRYSLRRFTIMQHKLEVKGRNWFGRAWTTQEDAGDAYTSAIMRLVNEAQKPTNNLVNPSGSWGPQYKIAYNTAIGSDPLNLQAAHTFARSVADQGRLLPGSARFQQIFDSLANRPISKGGAKFFDKSDLYMIEGQYKFDSIKFVDILVGASAKRYVLNSQGTLFADSAGRIHINEYGGFAQVQKSLFHDRLRLSVSGRYDKSTNFKGRFTPRVSALIRVAKDNNIRLSYQQAYRFPTTQNQWINLPTSQAIVLGGLPQLRDYYHMNINPVYTVQNVLQYRDTFVNVIGRTGSPLMAATAALKTLKPYQFGKYKAESMDSYEIGYKGLLLKKKLLVDAYVFWSNYHNFLGRINVIQSKSKLLNPYEQSTGLIRADAL